MVYLDAEERRWVDEMGSNNLFFVYGSGDQAEVVTPALTGSILPGITRDSLLVLAKELGCEVTERRISGTSGARARPTAGSPRSSAAARRR